jgi:RimJ/RimL family protein N-acetyltransferase
MIELFSGERDLLTKFSIPKEEVCIWSCIEGIMGRAWINDINEPMYGVVVVADFLFLLGQVPDELSDELKNIMETLGKNQIIVSENPDWENIFLKAFPEKLVRFMRYSFHWEPDIFDRKRLEDFAQGNDDGYEVVPFTIEIAEKALLCSFTADFCMFFESPEAFLKQGIGFCIIQDEQIVAGASSYSTCDGAIDITIGTINEYRRKGFALKCASKLILACIERGLYPRWDAANLESVALAEKLGYRFKEAYQVFTIK